eukprot:9015275-Pyramimonas_sp.AAC.1
MQGGNPRPALALNPRDAIAEEDRGAAGPRSTRRSGTGLGREVGERGWRDRQVRQSVTGR